MVQVVNNPPANAGDMGLTPGLGRSPEEGNGNPFQCSCLGSPMDRGAWWTTVHGVTKEKNQTLLSDWTTATKANLNHRHGIYLSPPLFLVLKIFWCEPLLKSLLNLLQYCSCFMFWFFGCEACRILAPQPGIELAPPALECKVLTTGLPGTPPSITDITPLAVPMAWLDDIPLLTWSLWPNLYYSWVFASKEKRTFCLVFVCLFVCLFLRIFLKTWKVLIK